MTIVFPPSDPMAQFAVARVERRYPERDAYRVLESDWHMLPGTRTFVVLTHCHVRGHGPCLWQEYAEYNPGTDRWLLLDLLKELTNISVAQSRLYLQGMCVSPVLDLLSPLVTHISSYGYLMHRVLEREEVRYNGNIPA